MIRGIPVTEIVAVCAELAQVFDEPLDLGIFIISMEGMITNPFWNLIKTNVSSKKTGALRRLLFDEEFRSALSIVIAIWHTNGITQWKFDDETKKVLVEMVKTSMVPNSNPAPPVPPTPQFIKDIIAGAFASSSSCASASSSSTSVSMPPSEACSSTSIYSNNPIQVSSNCSIGSSSSKTNIDPQSSVSASSSQSSLHGTPFAVNSLMNTSAQAPPPKKTRKVTDQATKYAKIMEKIAFISTLTDELQHTLENYKQVDDNANIFDKAQKLRQLSLDSLFIYRNL